MVVLPVRHVAIPEEKWNIIQRCINTAMAALKNRPSTKNTDMANDHNRFTRLMCFGLVIMLCSLFLIPSRLVKGQRIAHLPYFYILTLLIHCPQLLQ